MWATAAACAVALAAAAPAGEVAAPAARTASRRRRISPEASSSPRLKVRVRATASSARLSVGASAQKIAEHTFGAVCGPRCDGLPTLFVEGLGRCRASSASRAKCSPAGMLHPARDPLGTSGDGGRPREAPGSGPLRAQQVPSDNCGCSAVLSAFGADLPVLRRGPSSSCRGSVPRRTRGPFVPMPRSAIGGGAAGHPGGRHPNTVRCLPPWRPPHRGSGGIGRPRKRAAVKRFA